MALVNLPSFFLSFFFKLPFLSAMYCLSVALISLFYFFASTQCFELKNFGPTIWRTKRQPVSRYFLCHFRRRKLCGNVPQIVNVRNLSLAFFLDTALHCSGKMLAPRNQLLSIHFFTECGQPICLKNPMVQDLCSGQHKGGRALCTSNGHITSVVEVELSKC